MTVLDSSAVVDFLPADGAADEVAVRLERGAPAADAIFVALAEALGEPLAAKDAALARAAREQTEIDVIELGRDAA